MIFADKFPNLRSGVAEVMYEITKLINGARGYGSDLSGDEKQSREIIEDYIFGKDVKATNVWYIQAVLREVKDNWNAYDNIIKYAFSKNSDARSIIINRFCPTMTGHPDPGTKNAILTEVIPLHKLLLEISR